jgi:hypothetical protein
MHTTCPTHCILDLIILFGQEYKLRCSSLRNVLQTPITSYLFGPNTLLSIPFSNILSPCSSHKVKDLHSYKSTKFMNLRI